MLEGDRYEGELDRESDPPPLSQQNSLTVYKHLKQQLIIRKSVGKTLTLGRKDIKKS